MHTVVALVLPDVVIFDLSIAAEVFGHRDERQRYTFITAAVRAGEVTTTSGFTLNVPLGLEALDEADTVIIPGYAPTGPLPTPVIEALQKTAARGTRVLSICTGAFALAAAGLLDGHRATTHWRDTAELASRHPAVDVDADVLFIDGGSIMTSAGVAAGIDLCLHVYRTDHGAEAAADVARRMVVAPHRDGGQAQYLKRPTPAAGPGLAATCSWALEHLAEPLTVNQMADHAGWSARTLARRFTAETGTTPLRWLTAQRLLEARRLLETSDLSIDHVAMCSGFGTAANLRAHFAANLATTPTAYRHTYRGRPTSNRA